MKKSSVWSTVIALGVFAVALAGVRLWIGNNLGLAPDEAYYWQWSRDLQLAYYDHPPLIAWLIHAGTFIAGDCNIGVRLFCIVASSVAIFVTYGIGRAVGMDRTFAAIAAAFGTILPMPATGALLATPDTPLAVCWLLAVLALVRLIKKRSSVSWYVLFASIGVGLLVKHSALLMLVLVVIALIVSKKMRSDLRTVHPWLGICLFVAIISPYMVAEASAGFPSIGFQTAHLSGQLESSQSGAGLLATPIRLLELLGGQIGLLTPIVALWVVIALKKRSGDPALAVILAALFVPMAITALSALFAHPQQNWASLGHPLAAVLTIGAVSSSESISKQKCRGWIVALICSTVVITLIIHTHALSPFLPIDPQRDPVSRLHGWEGLSGLSPHTQGVDSVVCDNYGLAAELSWVLRHKQLNAGGLDRGFSPTPGKWLLLDERNDWGQSKLNVSCANKQPLKEFTLKRDDGSKLRVVEVYLGQSCVVSVE